MFRKVESAEEEDHFLLKLERSMSLLLDMREISAKSLMSVGMFL